MNQPLLVTLVDPDPKGLATLTFGFEKERFTVAGTSDLRMAHQLVQSTGARVAVVVLRPPEPQALGLIGELARAPTVHRPAVLALGPAASRRPALDAGAADFIDTPAFVRDVVLAGLVWLQARATAAHRDAGPEVTGALDAWHGLYYVIRAMSATQRSGVLQLTRGKRKGEVKFTDGAVTAAQVRGLQAFPALHQLLLWTGAELTLKLRDVAKRTQFSATGAEILDECERFLRDVHHALRQIGSLQAILARDARVAGTRAAAIPEEVAPVARLFDGVRTLGDVIEDSPFRVFDTLRAVKRLIDGGVVIARASTIRPSSSAGNPLPVISAAAAPPRARIKSGPHPAPPSAQAHEAGVLDDDRRGPGGDRRKSLRRTTGGWAKPAAKPAPAPIPLVTKKSPSGAFAAGEIRAPARPRHATPGRGVPVARVEPSVLVKLDPPALSLDIPVPAPPGESGPHVPRARAPAPAAAPAPAPAPIAAAPAPVAAPRPAAPVAPLTAREPAAPLRIKKAKTPVPPATAAAGPAFNALEADFFAREADLYKDQGGETFDDLEHGGEIKRRPRSATPRGSKKR